MTNKRCALCETLFDIHACNEDHTIISYYSDTDAKGTTINRKYFCEDCTAKIEIVLFNLKFKPKGEDH